MSSIERRLESLIEQAGVLVVVSPHLSLSLNSCYLSESRTIYVRRGLDPITYTCAVAHELGHAYYDHDCSAPRFEYQADRWAAKQLLEGRLTFEILCEYRTRPSALAAELGVTPRFLQVWLQLHRLGGDYPQIVF